MRITNNYQITTRPNFTSAIAAEKTIAYMNKNLTPKQITEVNKMFVEQNGKKPNIHYHLGSFVKPSSGEKMYYLRATVKEETFKEGLFTSAFGVIKKSIEYAKSLQKG